MAKSISNLFDYQSPENIRSGYLNNLFQPTSGGDLYSQLAQAGSNTGRAFGAAGGRLLGFKLPGEAKAEAMDQIMATAAKGENPLAQAKIAYDEFSKLGMGREAQITMERIDELKKAEEAQGFTRMMADPETQLKTSEDYLAASRAAYAAGDATNGNAMLNQAKALMKEEADLKKRTALVNRRASGIQANNEEMPEDVVSLVSEDDDLYKEWTKTVFEAKKNNNDISYQTYDGKRYMRLVDKDTGNLVKEVLLGVAPKTGTTINTGDNGKDAAQKEIRKKVAGDVAEELKTIRTAAIKAEKSLPKMYTALNILKTKPITTGLGASLYDILNQVRSQYLNDKEAGLKVTDDQYLDSLIGSDVFNAIADLGIGARGIDTPAEKDFLLEVVTGKRSLSQDALIAITEMRIKNTEKNVIDYNDRLSKGDYAAYEEALNRSLPPIKLRSADQPPSVSNWPGTAQ